MVIWVALGGRGTILGPILGAIAIDYLSASLSGDLPFLSQLILGVLFVVVIIVLPGGLAGLARMAWESIRPNHNELTAPVLIPLAQAKERPPTHDALLQIVQVAKSYGSLRVLQGIDLKVVKGELVSLVGPNGAGKTTLMRCLSDGTDVFTGKVEIAGQDIKGLTPDRIVSLGVGRKFQVASVFDSLSVAECLRLARDSIVRPSPIRSSKTLELPVAAIEILRLTGLDEHLSMSANLLSHGQKQALELAMIVSLEPQLILLDEPTAGLTKSERTTIGTVLQKLTSQLGFTAILVEHDLDFVREISSRIVVLHQGKLVLDGTVNEVVNSEIVKTIYSGGGHA
jgi:branched-chain amino acid transport system permease protein